MASGTGVPHHRPVSAPVLRVNPSVNQVPADVTGQTFSRPEGTFSRSYIASAPYLQPSSIGAFPDSGFLPGALPQHVPGNPPKWITHGFYWMPTYGRNFAGHSLWGPFENGYRFPRQDFSSDWRSRGYAGYYPYGGYGYYPYGWGGDGTFVLVGDSALRAWAGEPVDGYPPEDYDGPMPWSGMPMFFATPTSLPEGMAFAQFTGVPETIVLDFPPGARVRR